MELPKSWVTSVRYINPTWEHWVKGACASAQAGPMLGGDHIVCDIFTPLTLHSSAYCARAPISCNAMAVVSDCKSGALCTMNVLSLLSAALYRCLDHFNCYSSVDSDLR